jgi:hypothetical protein
VRYTRGSGFPFLCRLTTAKYILLVGGRVSCVCMLRPSGNEQTGAYRIHGFQLTARCNCSGTCKINCQTIRICLSVDADVAGQLPKIAGTISTPPDWEQPRGNLASAPLLRRSFKSSNLHHTEVRSCPVSLGLLNGVNRAVLITNGYLKLLGEHTVATRHPGRLPRGPFRLRDEAVLR